MSGLTLPATTKRYSYPYSPEGLSSPYAMGGSLTPGSPSRSLSQPGGSFPAPRAGGTAYSYAPPSTFTAPGGGAAAFAKGMPASQAFRPGGETPSSIRPTVMPSPYEARYREAAAGWEEQRGGLAAEIGGLTSPQAWASAGTPDAVWKANLDVQLGNLDQEIEGKRARIDTEYRQGLINAPERRARVEALEREYQQRKAQAEAGIASQKITEGRTAAMERANTLLGLYGQTPVAPEPGMIPIQPEEQSRSLAQGESLAGGGGLDSKMAAAMQLEAWAQKNPAAANALAKKYGGQQRW